MNRQSYHLLSKNLLLKVLLTCVAVPLKVAVIVPAEKLPLASLATTLLAVLASVASTAIVEADEPSKLSPVK
jgi:hypothetical protein